MSKTGKKGSIIFTVIIIALIGAVFGIYGTNSIITIDNNLDKYLPLYKILKDTHTYWTYEGYEPIFYGIDRSYFPADFKLYGVLYWIFPVFFAYVLSILLKIVISTVGTYLLFSELYRETEDEGKKGLYILTGLLIGLLPVAHISNIAFASIPLLVYIILKTSNNSLSKKQYLYFLFYPLLSDFRSFGCIVIIGLLIYGIVYAIKNKSFPIRILISWILLIIGYLLSEYRLFLDLFYYQDIKFTGSIDEAVASVSDNLTTIVSFIVAIAVLAVFAVLIKKGIKHLDIIAMAASIVIVLIPVKYNDVANTLFKSSDATSFSDYYSVATFDSVKKDINYMDQWIFAYNLDPAILEYNGLRVYNATSMYSSKQLNTIYAQINRIAPMDTDELNLNEFKKFCGKYVFSGTELNDKQATGLDLKDSYDIYGGKSRLYVYEVSNRYCDKEHSDISYEDRLKNPIEVEDYKITLDEINALCEDTVNIDKDRMKELFAASIDNLAKIQTEYQLTDVAHNADVTNEEIAERNAELYDMLVTASDETLQAFRAIANSEYKSVIEERYSCEDIKSLMEYEDMTDEEHERALKIQALSDEYSTASIEDYYFDYNGEEWSFERLNNEYQNLEYEDYIAIYQGIYEVKASAVGEIYLELLQLYAETASEEDCDSYMEYAYSSVYNRDYSVDDAKKLLKEIKKNGIGYVRLIAGIKEEYEEYDPGWITQDDTKTFNMLLPEVASIDKGAGEIMQHMLDNNLYDLSSSPVKAGVGFTVEFPEYGDAFIFDSPYEEATDFYTYVHEFGHYINVYNTTLDFMEQVNNMDVSEINSQGLEMLFAYNKYENLFDENTAKYLSTTEVYNIVNLMANAAPIAEFEIYAHEHPDSTVKELGREFKKICESYGQSFPDGMDEYYGWVDIPHIYTAPGYYIAYLTSGLSSLEIYTLANSNYEEAVERYLCVTNTPDSVSFRRALFNVGLQDIFKKGTTTNILKDVYLIMREKE